MFEVINDNGDNVTPDYSNNFYDSKNLTVIGGYAVATALRHGDMKRDDIIADCGINGLKHFFNEKGAKPAETMDLVEDLYKAGCLSSEKYEQLSDLIRYNSSENDDLERNDGIMEAIQIARENGFYVSGVNSVDDQLSFVPSDKLDPDAFNVYGHDGLIWMNPDDFRDTFDNDCAVADRDCAFALDFINKYEAGLQAFNVLHAIPVTKIDDNTYACGSENWQQISDNMWTDQVEDFIERLEASDISYSLENEVVLYEEDLGSHGTTMRM